MPCLTVGLCCLTAGLYCLTAGLHCLTAEQHAGSQQCIYVPGIVHLMCDRCCIVTAPAAQLSTAAATRTLTLAQLRVLYSVCCPRYDHRSQVGGVDCCVVCAAESSDFPVSRGESPPESVTCSLAARFVPAFITLVSHICGFHMFLLSS